MRMWLIGLREERRLTARDMAKILEIGISRYVALENGALTVTILLAARLADVFNIPLSRLVFYEQAYNRAQRPSASSCRQICK